MNRLFLSALGSTLVILSALLVCIFRRVALKKELLDHPNDRSSHLMPTPKGAGIVFVGLWCLSQGVGYYVGYLTVQELLWCVPGTLVVAVLGFWDDIAPLSAKSRFILQCLAVMIAIGTVSMNMSLWFLMPIVIIAWVWSINLFNFMDGLDGLAAIEAVCVLGVGGLVCWHYGIGPLAFVAWSMVCVVLGFLILNWPKASVFMGGVGSYALGFLIGALIFISAWVYHVPLVLWIIIYGVFWFDATVTLLRRMLYKQAWMSAHRSHAYQRLHQAGFSHQQVLFWVIGLNSILAIIVLNILKNPQFMLLGLGMALCILIAAYAVIEYIKPMEGKSVLRT